MRRFLGAGLLAPLLGAAGCASIFSDNDTTVSISTEPEGARCELVGSDFMRVMTTPASLSLPAGAAPVLVRCEAEGHVGANATLDTRLDGWILGNALASPIFIVGVIGVAIDTYRGAGQRFPSEITLTLDPESFVSLGPRDEWFGLRRAEVDEKWTAAIEDFTDRCRVSSSVECEPMLGELREQWEMETEDLEARRAAAAVAEG